MAVTPETLALLGDLRTTVGTEADDTVRDLANAWVKAWAAQSAQWRDAVRDLATMATDLGRWPYAWEQARIGSAQLAVQAAQLALSMLADQTRDRVTAAAAVAVAATVDAEPQLLASQLPASHRHTATALFAAALGAGAVAILTRRTGDHIADAARPIAGAASEAVRRALIAGVPVTGTPAAVARQVTERVHGAFTGGLTTAVTIARTDIIDANRNASRAVHQANRHTVRGWIWWCRCAPTSCPACWAMHGTEHPVDEPGPEGHAGCKCQRLPVLQPWANLGIDLVEPESAVIDGQTRFDLLPEADQLAVMGPARLALLRSGRIRWADLAVRRDNPGWRAAYQPRTVAALNSIARARVNA